jgi:hypothetical protein
VPESNLVSDENSGVPQHTHANGQSVSLGVERIGECALGAVLSCHPVLLGRELLFHASSDFATLAL